MAHALLGVITANCQSSRFSAMARSYFESVVTLNFRICLQRSPGFLRIRLMRWMNPVIRQVTNRRDLGGVEMGHCRLFFLELAVNDALCNDGRPVRRNVWRWSR